MKQALDSGKALFYHGTSADNLPSILKNGILPDQDSNWQDSEPRTVYLWCPERYAAAESNEGADVEEKHRVAFIRAAESAEFGLARAKDCRRVVLTVALDPESISDDTSSENMHGAVAHYGAIPPHSIVGIHADKDSLDLFRGYFIGGVMARENSAAREWTNIESAIGKIFINSEMGMELFEKLDDLAYSMQPLDIPEPPIESLSKSRSLAKARKVAGKTK